MNDDRRCRRCFTMGLLIRRGHPMYLDEMKRRRPCLLSAGCFLVASLVTAPAQALVTPRHSHRHQLRNIPTTIGHQDAVSTSRFNEGGSKGCLDDFYYPGDGRSTRLTTTRTGDEESKVRWGIEKEITDVPSHAMANAGSKGRTFSSTVCSSSVST